MPRLLLRELRRGNYDVHHERVDTASNMTAALDNQEWDLVISDYSMPCFSGVAALQLLRARNTETPFIFLSGTLGEETAVAALKGGAQDYLMKGQPSAVGPAIQRELREGRRAAGTQGPGTATAAGAENGSHRAPCRRHCARLQ